MFSKTEDKKDAKFIKQGKGHFLLNSVQFN